MTTSRPGSRKTGPAGYRHAAPARPRLGILDLHPIQYHTPLYQRLSRRDRVQLEVLYVDDQGLRPVVDAGFGVPVAWDIDLLAGYESQFLADPAASLAARTARLTRWLPRHDVVVIHGHSNPWMLAAAALCRARNVPYLLRGDAGPDGQPGRLRAVARHAVAHGVVAGSACGLGVGHRNAQFYARYSAPRIVFAPHSVDNERFAQPPATSRRDLLARWGVDPRRPVVMFCGKLQPAKRPLDLATAMASLGGEAAVLFVGDGALAGDVRAMLRPGQGAVTGFINQAELPCYYHAADVLVLPSQSEPWGLVVNEAMAAGVLPVVSDRVGCATDLVEGLGEVYPCGDISALTAALRRALDRAGDPQVSARLRERVTRYGVDTTVAGFEYAAVVATRSRRRSEQPLHG
jgi:glycosyltransferase involved in cell wall biosynthesis